MSGDEQVVEWQVLPTGMDPDKADAAAFAVVVRWRGAFNGRHGGGWCVTHCGQELSRSGQWSWSVPRFRRWQHRWETFEEAQEQARGVVDSLKVNGRTFAEWQAVAS